MDIFKEKGTQYKRAASEVFVLDKKDAVFAFEGASLNLFAQRRQDKAGREFLGHFTNALLFNLDAFDAASLYEIIAVPEGDVTIYECAESSLKTPLQQDEKFKGFFLAGLQEWVEKLSKKFELPHAAGTPLKISSGQSPSLLETDILIHKIGESLWVKVIEGKIDLYGEKAFALSPEESFYPLTPATWFTTKEESKIEAIDTITLINRGLWQDGRATFSHLFSLLLPAFIKHKEEQERILQVSRIKTEKENLFFGLKELIAIFKPSFTNILRKTEDPLEQACLLIAHFMKIKFIFPRNTSEDIPSRIESICLASQIQQRRVRLEGEWWKEDHGPLLAFHGEEKRPVVLVYGGKYKMLDAYQNVPVTAKLAKEISPDVCMFYVPFDVDIKTGKDVIRFVFKNHFAQWLSIIPFSLIGAIYALFPPVATKLLFKYAIPESNPSLMLYLTCGLLFSAIGFSFFYFLRGLFYLRYEGLGSHLLQTAFWDRLLKLSPGFFRRYTGGNLFYRIFSIEEIRVLLSVNASNLIFTGFFAFIYLGIMIYYAPLLSFLIIGFAIVGILITAVCSYLKVQALKETLEIEGNMRGTIIQMIRGVGKLRAAGVDNSAFAYWTSFFAKANRLRMKAQNMQNIVTVAITVLPILSTWVIYMAMMEGVHAQQLPLPDFLAFNIAFGSFAMAIYPLNNTIVQVINVFPLWDRARVILEEPIEEGRNADHLELLSGDIRIDNIVFGYDPEQPPIINDLSLVVKPQEFIGIVGKSGCGKSTLVRLLLGFEQPSSGVIYFNGKDLASLNLQAVRQQLGIVLQDGGIIGGSLYEVLTSGGRYTQEQLDRAFQLSGFDEDVASFSMGIHTYIPQDGGTLSGGQKQRLLLARALLGNPSVLIFDEATSALDNKSQDKIIQNIESLNVTRIAIAQRLSTIKHADRIYVIDQGKIIQQGTFKELAAVPGLFAEMLSRQKF